MAAEGIKPTAAKSDTLCLGHTSVWQQLIAVRNCTLNVGINMCVRLFPDVTSQQLNDSHKSNQLPYIGMDDAALTLSPVQNEAKTCGIQVLLF